MDFFKNGYHVLRGEVKGTITDAWFDIKGIEEEVLKHFEEVKKTKPRLTNGELFMVPEKKVTLEQNGDVNLPIQKTNYALYLYLGANPNTDKRYKVRSVPTVSVLSTSNDYFVFGKMASYTVLEDRILAPGGPPSSQEIDKQKGKVDFDACMRRELQEETGLTCEQLVSLEPRILHAGNERPAIAIIYYGKLMLDDKQIKEFFENHNRKLIEKGEKPELSDVEIVHNNPEALARLYHDPKKHVIDYLHGAIPLLG